MHGKPTERLHADWVAWGALQGCNTTFVEAARNTTGLDVLVQAILRTGLEDQLPSPGAGLTAFAPTNAAFLQMMQALRESLPLPPRLSPLLP
jgi:uncharacterized surface protein with fasciclin (FAS1) repeats